MPDDLAIIIPVYNEAENIIPLAQEVAKVIPQMRGIASFEIIFIDDASTDETPSRIAQARESFPEVRGLRHTRNAGQSAALWTGIQDSNSSLLATLDGDGQNDPADLPALFDALHKVDFASGKRTNRQDTWLRRVSSLIACRARGLFLKSNFEDTGCALRLFRREVLTGIFPYNGFHRMLPVLVEAAGFRCREIPVGHRPRQAGVSKYGIRNRLGRGIHDLIGLRWYMNRRLLTVENEPIGDKQPCLRDAK